MSYQPGDVVRILYGVRIGQFATVWALNGTTLTVGLDGGLRSNTTCRVGHFETHEVERAKVRVVSVVDDETIAEPLD